MTHGNHTSRQLRGRGITLIELMVALTITTFVVLVVNQLFNGVVQTVGRGTQAGEILQRSRAFDEQIATETELIISGGRDPKNNPYDWFGRMVGPKGREPGQPGGFLVVVQRAIPAPLTLDDQVKGIMRGVTPPYAGIQNAIRSDQLMFIYDQTPLFDQTGKKRLPPLAPVNNGSFGGDMWNSLNAEYVRIWYGHAVQLPADPTTFNLLNDDLGLQNANNPNAVAQDWVLGRHALFLTGFDPANFIPTGVYSSHVFPAIPNTLQNWPGLNGRLGDGLTDVSSFTLDDIFTRPGGPNLNSAPTALAYQALAIPIAFTQAPLLTTAKPDSTLLDPKFIAPTHTYFMGGVSDFIVEFAGDLVDGTFYQITSAAQVTPDGELDRDPEGRIKWYSTFSNPKTAPSIGPPNINAPITYPSPTTTQYTPNMNPALLGPFRADAAFVWQNEGSNGFTSWPWMLRIRYRLHDRRGQFEGREVTVNTATGETVPEAGAWFETIIPVNTQGIK